MHRWDGAGSEVTKTRTCTTTPPAPSHFIATPPAPSHFIAAQRKAIHPVLAATSNRAPAIHGAVSSPLSTTVGEQTLCAHGRCTRKEARTHAVVRGGLPRQAPSAQQHPRKSAIKLTPTNPSLYPPAPSELPSTLPHLLKLQSCQSSARAPALGAARMPVVSAHYYLLRDSTTPSRY